MKKNLFLTIALFGGLFLFATSCVKETNVNDKYRPVGGEIIFSAATGYDNGVETRTEYTGDMKTVTGYNNPFERIDWVTNDPLKIYYRRGTGSYQNATYKITGSNNASNEITKASATADGTKLYWADGSGDHKFYGMYPANGFQGNTSAQLSNNRASGSIPATQNIIAGSQKTLEGIAKYMPDMKYAYMVCYQEVASNSNSSTVELPFRPAMTAFEFRFKLGDQFTTSSVKVKSFKLTSASTDLTGNFAFDITGKDATDRATIGTVTKSNTGREINVSFGTNGVNLTKTDILDFTVFALPVDQTGLTIEFTFAGEPGASDFTRKLDLKHSGSFVTFDACKKYVITNTNIPSEVWDYFIDPIDDKVAYGHNPVTATNVFTYNVYSYKVKRGTTTKVPVPWHLECYDGSDWSETVPSPFTASTTSGTGSNGTTYQSGYSTITTTASGSTTGDADNATRAALATATPRGTSSSYFDLSMHPCYGNKDATTSQNTANCYIVAAPGYYKFPLVYGNAIKNGADNVISYAPESVTHIYQNYKSESHLVYQANFHNAINENITSPYILTDLAHYGTVSDLDIAIIWQDVPSTDLILPFDNPTFDNPSNPAYIQFNITPEAIQQGNVIIALRGKVAGYLSTKEILWSWHIWVTEKDLAPVTVQHAYNGTSEMAKYNLGWTDKTNASSTKYPDRILNLKVIQDEGPNKEEPFKFTQYGDATSTDDNVGSNAFYQWGRKDPFLTATHMNKNKTVSTQDYTVSSGDNQLVQEAISSSGDPDFGYGIRHPYLVLKNDYSTGWVGGAAHVGGTDAQRQNSAIAYNLWSAYVRGQHDKTNYGGSKAKTVYDPCPPGFEVPSKNAFMGFAGYTAGVEAPNQVVTRKGTPGPDGFNFYCNGASGATIYLPYCGARGYNHTEIYDVTNTAYYWTDAPDVSTYDGPDDHDGWRMSKLLYFFSSEGGGINANYDLYKGAAYAVRPVLESVQRVNSDVTTGGMEGNGYNFNDGWTIN